MPGDVKKKRIWRWIKIIVCSLVIAFFIRFFLFESFRMPSSQMENAILPGDFIYVDKMAYGFRVPAIENKSLRFPHAYIRAVERNDIVVYKTGNDIMISRCIGLPGDSFEVKAFEYYVNGQKVLQSPDIIMPYRYASEKDTLVWTAMKKYDLPFRDSIDENEEKIRYLSKYEYYILTDALKDSVLFSCYEKDRKDYKIQIPAGKYWMLSDNVDASADSRYVGFVSHDDLVGQASFVWFSKDPLQDFFHGYRWSRIFNRISR